MSEWTEGEVLGVRYRYQQTAGENAHPLSGVALEYWHDQRREWRAVRTMNQRDWFAIGLEAGKLAANTTDSTQLEAFGAVQTDGQDEP